MIEFGAGGTIVHNDSETNATGSEAPVAEGTAAAPSEGAAEGTAGTPATEGAPAAAQAPPIPTIQTNPRRKRKAKGWFCPVCRQRKCHPPSIYQSTRVLNVRLPAYTSLLRITTTPPEMDEKDDHGDSASGDEHVPQVVVPAVAAPAVPPPVVQADRGRFASIPRPGFLRGFGRQGAPQPDLERGTAPAANAA